MDDVDHLSLFQLALSANEQRMARDLATLSESSQLIDDLARASSTDQGANLLTLEDALRAAAKFLYGILTSSLFVRSAAVLSTQSVGAAD